MQVGERIEVFTLVALGLEERLARLWTAMTATPGAGVAELAETLAISESQVRECLDALADRALVRVSQQHPGLILPITPQAALARLVHQQEQELAEQQRRIAAQRDAITARLQAADEVTEHIEYVIGADDIHARFERIALATTTSVDTLMPVTGLPEHMLRDAWPLDEGLLRRGVLMRGLYLEAIRNDAPLAAYARDLQAGGAQIRTSPTLPQRLFIADRRIAVVPLDPRTRGVGAAVVSAAGVIASLLELFEAVWRSAAPLDVGNPVDAATGLSDTERTLLTLLAEGATDEAVAKKLSVSVRTVRRIMADLMQRLDAGSRFEAGMKAAKRGWL